MDTLTALNNQTQSLQQEMQNMRQERAQPTQQQPPAANTPQTDATANGAPGAAPAASGFRSDISRLGRPPKPFEGTQETWDNFRFNFTSFAGTVDPRLPDLLDDAARRSEPIDMVSSLTQADRDRAVEFLVF